MKLIQIYECFCDETRLRIIHLLAQGPLCVCHFQELLGEPQVKISKHLAYMKTKGIVDSVRQRNWMIYSLPEKPGHELNANLSCLQDCVQTHPVFKRDLRRRAALRPKLRWLDSLCCGSAAPESVTRRMRMKAGA